ncbi:hypothetical protein [Cohnella nanjingensis]|uniref:Copper amine oxidase-like N-terminal domain-containing protein n=1 Tax=Cohnella nanjingensis TaxID=1387779 RepID=A0A7X0RRL0_9BACL|nr:hypothetical protein [Cohnella nanjingensis]MBB6670999.1 hypothetical protein [Cohnella nanjingensis]
MRKALYVFIGIMIGTVISFGIGASRGKFDSLIGKGVQSERELLYGGETVGTAVVIDGTTYAPLRALGERLGLKIDFGIDQVVMDAVNLTLERPKSLTPDKVEANIAMLSQRLNELLSEMDGGTVSKSQQMNLANVRLYLAMYEKWKLELQGVPSATVSSS